MVKKNSNSFQTVGDLQKYLDSIYINNSIDGSEYINFFDSSLDERLLPSSIFENIKSSLSAGSYLGYSDPYGLEELRKNIASYYFGDESLFKNINITSGAQQGLYVLTKFLSDQKNFSGIVGFEEFSYIGYKHIVESLGLKVVEIDMKKDGLSISSLKGVCKNKKKNIDILYLIPFLQNPTGINYSRKRLNEIFNLQKKYGFKIIIDVSYYDLVNNDLVTNNLPDLIREDVYIVGTFSKVLMADLRLGWVFVPQLAKELAVVRRSLDLFQPVFIQRAVSQFLVDDFRSYTVLLRDFFMAKRNLLVFLFELFRLDQIFTLSSFNGGFYLWLKIKRNRKIKVDEYLKQKLFIAPGTFFGGKNGASYLRLCYSRIKPFNFIRTFNRISIIYNCQPTLIQICQKIINRRKKVIIIVYRYLFSLIKIKHSFS